MFTASLCSFFLSSLNFLQMDLRNIPEEVVKETLEYKCLQSQFSLLYNESLGVKTQLDEARALLLTTKNAHLRQIEHMEVEPSSCTSCFFTLASASLPLPYIEQNYIYIYLSICFFFNLLEWWAVPPEEAANGGHPVGGYFGPSAQRIWDVAYWIWTKPGSQWTSRYLQPLQMHLKKECKPRVTVIVCSSYTKPNHFKSGSTVSCSLFKNFKSCQTHPVTFWIQLNPSVISNLLPLRTHQPGNATLN